MTVQTPSLVSRKHPPRSSEDAPRRAIPERLLFGLIGFVGLLILWEAAVRLGYLKASLASSPTGIFNAAVSDFGSGVIWPHIETSFIEWLVGFALALAVAIPIGFALGSFRRLEYLFDPLIAALYATPTVALVPLIILVFGVNLPSKFAVVFLEAFVTLVVATVNGVNSTDRRWLEIATSFGAPKGLVFRSVTLPSSTPYIITGVRIAAGRALVGVVVAEFIASNIGLGFYISENGSFLNSSRVMLGIALIGGFGVLVGELIRRLERRFEVWRPSIN